MHARHIVLFCCTLPQSAFIAARHVGDTGGGGGGGTSGFHHPQDLGSAEPLSFVHAAYIPTNTTAITLAPTVGVQNAINPM